MAYRLYFDLYIYYINIFIYIHAIFIDAVQYIVIHMIYICI